MRPMIGESVDVIENLFVRSEGGKCVWAGVRAARRTGTGRGTALLPERADLRVSTHLKTEDTQEPSEGEFLSVLLLWDEFYARRISSCC